VKAAYREGFLDGFKTGLGVANDALQQAQRDRQEWDRMREKTEAEAEAKLTEEMRQDPHQGSRSQHVGDPFRRPYQPPGK
jgi:hypothetical protein